MTGVAPVSAKMQFSDASGIPLAGGLIDVYLAGTTTRTDTWQDRALSTLNTNPIVLDARGECLIWTDGDIAYKFVLKNSLGVVQWTMDNITGAAGAAALVNFIQAGTGAVSRDAQSKMRDIVSVFDFMTAAQIADAQAFTYTQDLTTPLNNALTAAAGKMVYHPEGGYLSGRILPQSNTTLWFDGGSTLRKKTNGTQCLKVSAKSNVHIVGNGCTFDGQTNADATSGDTVNFSDSHDCSMTDVHVLGAGTAGSDCIYIGSDGNDEPCTNIRIIGGSCTNGRRNGISVAAGFDILIEGVEISGTTGNPGAGVDVEANVYAMVGNVTIRRCHIHNNEDWGVNVVFGDKVWIYENRIHNNGDPAVATGAGGTQFNAGVARSNVDIVAVSSVNTGTEELTISGASAIPVGCIVAPAVRGAGVLPTGLTATQHFVLTNNGTAVTLSANGSTAVNLTTAGSGTLTTDPTTSEIYLKVYAEGQSSNVHIFRNHCYDNGGTRGEIDLSTAVNVSVYDNILEPALDNSGIFCTFARGISLKENQIKGDSASTSATARGIHVGVCSGVETFHNRIRDFSGIGINVGSLMVPGNFIDDRIVNCGSAGNYMVKLDTIDGLRMRGTRCRMEGGYTVANGISAFSNITNSVITDADIKSVGSSNATSLSWSGSGNRIENCRQFDGTWWGSGSVSFNPASLADGAREAATAITVAGAALGDMVEASFSLNLQGVKLIAYVSAADTVQPVFENESGGVVDLASGTIYVKVSKR